MSEEENIEIKLLSAEMIVGWSPNIKDTLCKICDGKLILPPKNINLQKNKIIKNDKIVVGKCEHSYHKSCLEEYGDCCFEDNLVFKEDRTINTSLSKLL